MGKRRSLDPEKLLAEFEENGVPSPEETERKTPEQIEVEAIAQVIEKLRDKGHTERGVFDYLRDRGLGVKSFKTFQKHNPVEFGSETNSASHLVQNRVLDSARQSPPRISMGVEEADVFQVNMSQRDL